MRVPFNRTLGIYWWCEAMREIRAGRSHVAEVYKTWYSYRLGPYDYLPEPGSCTAKAAPSKQLRAQLDKQIADARAARVRASRVWP